MRTIFIGDVHGCIVELIELIQKLQPQTNDMVVFVGDLMDKGPDGPGCVQYARQMGFISILGNHEDKHIRWMMHEYKRLNETGYQNPMNPSDAFIRENQLLAPEDRLWVGSLPIIYQTMSLPDKWVAVHGGLLPGIPLEDQVSKKKHSGTILRLRWLDENNKHVPVDYNKPMSKGAPEGCHHWADVYDGEHNVVYGHEAHHLSNVRIDTRPNGASCFGIDTGCVHGGHLTALVITHNAVPLVEFVQVKAKKKYAEPPVPIPG